MRALCPTKRPAQWPVFFSISTRLRHLKWNGEQFEGHCDLGLPRVQSPQYRIYLLVVFGGLITSGYHTPDFVGLEKSPC